MKKEAAKVLVVDDISVVRRVFEAAIRKFGYDVTTASNGMEALELLRDFDFDLVISDLTMPVMDGLQLLKKIKEEEGLRNIPVLMTSGQGDPQNALQCIQMGAEDYLPKPVDPVVLGARIKTFIEKKALRDTQHLYFSKLRQVHERLEHELEEASKYVSSLLPAPTRDPVRIEWHYTPSSELGGDVFGYRWVDADHLMMYLLDVEGHGVGAALLSVTLRGLLEPGMIAADLRDPGAVLTSLNKLFLMASAENRFFTIWYGVYHKGTRRLNYCSAGHPPALLVERGKNEDARLKKLRTHFPAIGLMPRFPYESSVTTVSKESALYLYSDGTSEMEKENGRLLSFEEFTEPLLRWDEEVSFPEYINYLIGMHGSDTFRDDMSLIKVDFGSQFGANRIAKEIAYRTKIEV